MNSTEQLEIPTILSTRQSTEVWQDQRRYIDNEEMVILGMLENDGSLSSTSRLVEFLVLMTRLTKIDHRVLCIHILSKRASHNILEEFVVSGGLRIVKRWIKTAELEENLEELRSLVFLCRSLPFKTQAIKITEIGKTIKKLLKFKCTMPGNGDDASVALLHEEVRSLMTHWMEQANIAAAAAAAEKAATDAISVPTLSKTAVANDVSHVAVVTVRSNAMDVIEAVDGDTPMQMEETPDMTRDDSAAMDVETVKVVAEQIVSAAPAGTDVQAMSQIVSAAECKPDTAISSVATTPFPVTAPVSLKLNIVRVADTTSSAQQPPAVSLATPVIADLTVPSLVPPIKAAPLIAGVARRKPTDMAEGARKLLAMRAQAQSESSAKSSAAEAVVEEVPLASRRGGIKKSGGPKRAQRSIQWADDHGGALREVHTIEVERIKSSTASYKSHRDLVKKERQLEKEVHLSKAQDAMHKNTEWRAPPPLKLSVEVLDNSTNPVDSAERELQTRRLAHVLEARYLDDSLIPNDPDEALADAPSAAEEVPVKTIPWFQPGTEPVLMPPPSSSGAMGVGSSYPSQAQYGQGPGTAGEMRSDSSYMALVASLPLSLQRLDASVLQQIIQDQSLLLSLLNPDGSVDENRVAILQGQLSSSRGGSRFAPSSSGGGGSHMVGGPGGRGQYEDFSARRGDFGNGDMSRGRDDGFYGGDGDGGGFRGASPMSGGRPRTRWGGAADGIMNDFGTDTHGGDGRGDDSYYAPQGPGQAPRGGGTRFGPRVTTAPQTSFNLLPSAVVGGSGPITRPAQQSRGGKVFTGTKASTACRFFNTAKGCQFGDKCEFGHFAAGVVGGGPVGGAPMDGLTRRPGPGSMSRQMGAVSGPGMRR